MLSYSQLPKETHVVVVQESDDAGHRSFLRNYHQDVFQSERAWRCAFHAVYGEFNGVFNIDKLEMMEGDLPVRAQRLVREWASQYQEELLRMWQTNEFTHLPGLE